MVTRSKILSLLPAYRGSAVLLTENQSTNDIMYGIFDAHEDCKRSYDRICNLFLAENLNSLAKNIFDFLKANVNYKIESLEAQTLRDPQAIIATGKTIGADCKNYALFSAGILDALNREGYAISWCYRFAGYKYGKRELGHVFVVINPQTDNEIWIDPVASYFTERKQPQYFVDKKLAKENTSNMALYRLSGYDESGKRYTNVYDFVGSKTNWGKMYMPVNPQGLTTNAALSHAMLMQRLQTEANMEIKNGLKQTRERYKKYDAALGNLYAKIADFETGKSDLGEEITESNSVKVAMSGGLIDLVVGGEKWNNLKEFISKSAIAFLYLYIPNAPNNYEGYLDPNWGGHWPYAPNAVTDAMTYYAPSVVWQKKKMAAHTSWDWGSWGSLSVENQVYPFLYQVICAQLGQTPEAFWTAFFRTAYAKDPARFKKQVTITPQDNGVFSGMSANNVSLVSTDIKNMAASALSGVSGWFDTVRKSGNLLGGITSTITGFLTKVKFTYPVVSFLPSASDWSDYDSLGLNPFANGFPPKAGMWSGFTNDSTGDGSIIDQIDPHNPTPQGDKNTLLYVGAAAAIGYMLYKKHK